MLLSLLRLLFLLPLCGLMSCSTLKNSNPTPAVKSSLPLKTVAHVDLPRYMGDWRVISVIPYFAERNAWDSIESYALLPDGKIDNWFRCRRGSFAAKQKRYHFTAEVVNRATNAEWRVKFLPFIKVPYLIIDLDPEYQWTVIGHPSRKYGWIMARDKTLPASVMTGIHGRLAEQGYDPSLFVMVPQVPPAP